MRDGRRRSASHAMSCCLISAEVRYERVLPSLGALCGGEGEYGEDKGPKKIGVGVGIGIDGPRVRPGICVPKRSRPHAPTNAQRPSVQQFGPETYAYTAKRYTFPYTRMRMELDQQKLGERVRVGVRVRGQGRRGAWPAIAPDPCRPADTVYPKKFSQIGRGQSVKPTHPL